MLTEFTAVRQIPQDGFRRWFTDEEFDLYVWYTDSTKQEIVGFQLCYNKDGEQKALTWRRNRGYLHNAIDDGESSPFKNRTPILVADGTFPRNQIAERFRLAAKHLEPALFALVESRIAAYPGTR